MRGNSKDGMTTEEMRKLIERSVFSLGFCYFFQLSKNYKTKLKHRIKTLVYRLKNGVDKRKMQLVESSIKKSKEFAQKNWLAISHVSDSQFSLCSKHKGLTSFESGSFSNEKFCEVYCLPSHSL